MKIQLRLTVDIEYEYDTETTTAQDVLNMRRDLETNIRNLVHAHFIAQDYRGLTHGTKVTVEDLAYRITRYPG